MTSIPNISRNGVGGLALRLMVIALAALLSAFAPKAAQPEARIAAAAVTLSP